MPIFCNQVEYHPYLSQPPVLRWCRGNDVLIVAHSPLAHGRVFKGPILKETGTRQGKTPGQVALRWLLQQPGVGAIPKSASPDHMRENLQVFDFELTEEEMKRIFRLETGERLTGSPVTPAPEWDT